MVSEGTLAWVQALGQVTMGLLPTLRSAVSGKEPSPSPMGSSGMAMACAWLIFQKEVTQRSADRFREGRKEKKWPAGRRDAVTQARAPSQAGPLLRNTFTQVQWKKPENTFLWAPWWWGNFLGRRFLGE